MTIGFYIDNYIDIDKLVNFRNYVNSINKKNKITWCFTIDFFKLIYTYVSSVVNVIDYFVNTYNDSIGLGFGFMNHKLTLDQMINDIIFINNIYTNILTLNTVEVNTILFSQINENMKPKSVMSYSINQDHIKWIKDNLGIKYFMSWTATQTNVDDFSGEGTILSPYYMHKDNPMIPANNINDSNGCLILNNITIDPVGCRNINGESRWTIHPADPLTDGLSQIMLFRRYLSNIFIDKNHFNYFSFFFDSKWIFENSNLYNSMNNILSFLKSISIRIMSIDELCNNYTSKYKDNNYINFKLLTNGLGFKKDNNESNKDIYYLWYENKNYRIIYNKIMNQCMMLLILLIIL